MKHNGIENILKALADQKQVGTRFIVAIAGAPGSGKSTFANALQNALNEQRVGQAEILPMDGFHLDNSVLIARDQLAHKGAPNTFDIDGFATMLARIRAADKDVIVPVFDRDMDVARAGCRVIGTDVNIVIVEGNYLLLDRPEWQRLAGNYDLTIGLDVDLETLEQRLVQRWIDQGMTTTDAKNRAHGNDMTNVATVINEGLPADITISTSKADGVVMKETK